MCSRVTAIVAGLVLVLTACAQPILPVEGCDGGCPPGSDGGPGHLVGSDGGPVATSCTTDAAAPVVVPSPSEAGGFHDVRALAFDERGQLFVLDREWTGTEWTGTVFVLSADKARRVVRTMGRGTLGFVRDIAVAPNGRVFVLSYERFEDPMLHSFEPDGTPRPSVVMKMSGGESLVVAANGELIIGDTGFYRFDHDGNYLGHFGAWGDFYGGTQQPVDLAIASDGRLWVADLGRNNLQQHDPVSGAFLGEYGGRGAGPGRFDEGAPDDERWGPYTLEMAGNAAVYASDPFQSRIQKLSLTGTYLGEFGFGGSRVIGAMAVEPSTGHLYVSRKTSIDVVCPF